MAKWDLESRQSICRQLNKKILDYIEKHNMQITGFSREITLIDYGITNDPEKFVTQICIPVKCD